MEKPKEEEMTQKTDTDNGHAICLQGVLKFLNQKQMEREVAKVIPNASAVFKPKNKPFCFVLFKTEEEKEEFMGSNQKVKIKNREARVRDSNSNINTFKKGMDQRRKERKIMESKQNRVSKIYTDVREKIAPYWQMEYKEQLALKENGCKAIYEKIAEKVIGNRERFTGDDEKWLELYKQYKQDNTKTEFFNNFKEISFVDNWKDSPRNKIECTFGNSDKGIVLGFILNIIQSKLEISNDFSIDTIDNVMVGFMKKIEGMANLLRQENEGKHDFSAYDNSIKSGFFRNVVLRKSQVKKELVAKLVINSAKDDDRYSLLITLLKNNLSEGFMDDHKLVGFVVETYDGISNVIPNVKENQLMVCGTRDYVFDVFLDKNFKIPLDGFFQIHKLMAEMMFKKIEKLLNLDENTILLDVCAGTGAFGITLGEKSKEIVFIEMESSACNMIKDNLLLNWALEDEKNQQQDSQTDSDNKNTVFSFNDKKFRIYNQKIEDCISEIHSLYSGKDMRIVAIVDPPRAGLHPKVVKSLRTFKGVDELVFVSCDFKQAKQNIIDLCAEETKRVRGPPFSPVEVYPFDIFPLTPHFETVIYLKRFYG